MSKVLIVVDMQKGFMTKPEYIELSDKIQNYLDNASYEKVYFTKFVNKKHSLYQTKLGWFRMTSKEEQEFSLNYKNAEVFEKTGYGLTESQLNEIVSLNEKEVDICGVETDACVYAIAFQLFDKGIFPNILINYVATTKHREETMKQILIRQFGSVDER